MPGVFISPLSSQRMCRFSFFTCERVNQTTPMKMTQTNANGHLHAPPLFVTSSIRLRYLRSMPRSWRRKVSRVPRKASEVRLTEFSDTAFDILLTPRNIPRHLGEVIFHLSLLLLDLFMQSILKERRGRAGEPPAVKIRKGHARTESKRRRGFAWCRRLPGVSCGSWFAT